MKFYGWYLLSAAIIPFSVDAAVAQDTTSDASADQGNALGDIIVNAQRVDQRIQDVPVSISAFSSEDIDRRQINSTSDLSRLSPNVKFDPISGGSTGLKPFIRGGGVSDGGIVTSESEVSFYVDNIYRARISAGLVDFVELERIEVLRGPQGVLYGRNSSAGAVNFITRAPTDTLQATVLAGYGTWNERRLKGFVSGPIDEEGKWRASLNGMVRARDGGRQYNITLGKKVGKEKFQGVQGDLAYVGDIVEGRLTGFYTNTDTDGQYASANTAVGANPNTAVITLNNGSFRKVSSPVPSYTHVEQYGSNLRLSAEYPGGTLTSISGYSHLADKWRQDFSGGVSLGGPVLALFDRTSAATQHQFSEELQAAGSAVDGVLDYVAGLYYFTETGDQTVNSTIFFTPSSIRFQVKTNSFAGFGQLTVNATDKIALIIGGRYTLDDKQLNATLNGVVLQTVKNSYEKFTPKFGINYKPTNDILFYASYSEGFKSGGYNGLASTPEQVSTPFLPQLTKAYELGVKADLFDRVLRLNLVGFYNKIANRQNTLTLPTGAFVVENYNAQLQGLELETTWLIVKGLTLWGNGALNKGKYTSGGYSSGVLGSIIGNKLPVFPKYSYTVGIDYEVVAGAGTFKMGADYGGRDAYYSTADNAAIGLVEKQELLNGYVGYDVGPWAFQVAGKNLLQETGSTSGFGFGPVQPRYAIEPRTVMGTVRYTF